MSSVSENLSPAPVPPPAEQEYVDAKIRRTRRALKTVDVVAGLITLAIGVLSYLLTMAALEHWIVPGGLSSTARAILLLVLLGGVGWYGWRYFWPLLTQPINPVYAAHTIEQGSPSLKNSLLNLLLLRDRRRQISRQVYQAIEHQAAQRLSQVPVDTTVDRSAILRLGYVLVAVLAVCLLYRVFSPKDPVASAGRLLMPWSSIPVPSRVQILDIQPGDTSAARGEQVTISAEILGKHDDESVKVVYSQTDGQLVDQEIIMTGAENSLRYSCRLPGRIALGGGGIQSDLTYHIEAGDARSPEFSISVFSQPTLVVERIRYEYPSYTRYPPREEEFTGDISAVEGTTVTLYAVANQPIEMAHVDFEADGRHDLLMNAEGKNASVRFQLELEEDRRTPKHQSYVLRYTTPQGRRNPAPPKYQIDVQRDYSPEIELLEPREEVLEVGLNDEVVLKLEARDPDFALRNVAFLGEAAGERVLKKALLSSEHTGRYEGQLKFVPAEHRLKEGDVLEYWGAAADNRRPEPNISFTKHQKLRIVGAGTREPLPDNQEEGQEGEGQQGESGDQQGEGEQGEGQEGNAGGVGSQQQEGENSDQQQGAEGEGQQGEGSGQQQEGQEGGSAESEGASGGEQNGSADGQSSGEQSDSEQQGENDPGEGNPIGQPSEENSRVSPDGDNDSEAFQRMADHFNEKDQEGAGNQSDQPQTGEQQEQSGERQDPQAQGEDGSQSENAQQQSGEEQAADGAGQDQSQDGQQGDSERQQEGDQQAGSEQSGQEEGPQQQSSETQEGAEGQGDQQEQSDAGKQGGEQQQGDSPNGEMNKEQGSEGAGQNPGENQGSPNPDGAQKPSEKNPGESDDSQLNEQEAPADSRSQNESDSEGGQGGDRSGGGQEGAGQQADEQGTGAAGENESAEDGAGESSQQGEGETGQEAGEQAQADGKTGESSRDQQGEGSEQSQQPGEQAGGDQSASGEQDGQPGENASKPSETGGTPEGGGTGSNDTPPPSSGEPLPGDEANLEYARKQTDLVLNRLEDQLEKKQVDEELLDKLGWTPQELRRFVERWKNLKDKAAGGGPDARAAQEELDVSLQSLGLNSNRQQGFQARTAKDKLRDLRESFRGRTPLEYEDLMRRYVKGTSAADEE